ncbi:hypothetical protein [Nocardia stercoris]|uniref:Uncharacterized protein n=1 Tax=Nocardia stercoris TaxID=2483361 RepID=A0A3M2KWH8_9NOCA|nr:hypothetical protein [Nocardia stercoris]RMI28986.1 hypothetical protein EBN03_28030 [Nocardia stercoris]
MSGVADQFVALADRLSTYLRKYVQEVHAQAGHLIDSGLRVPQELLDSDAVGAGQIRDAMRAENSAARKDAIEPDRGTRAEALTPQLPEGQRPIFPDRQNVAKIVHSAGARRGNFGIGEGGRAEADAAGLAWVGVDARRLPYGDTYRLVSKDGLRQYRPPQQKPSGRGVEANYEWRSESGRHWESNAHLVIQER